MQSTIGVRYSTSQKKCTVITVPVPVFTERTVRVVVVQDKHETLLVLTAVATSSHASTYAFLILVVG